MKSSGRARSPRGLDGWVSPATETRPPARTGPVGARQRFLCPPFHVFCPFVPFGWLLSFSRSGWGTWSGGGAAAACGGVPQGAPVRLRAWATAGATENDQQCALESHRPPAASSVVAGYAPPTADAAALNSTRGRVFIRHRSGLCWRRPSPALRFARCARQPSGPRLVTSHARRAGVCRYRHPPPPSPPRSLPHGPLRHCRARRGLAAGSPVQPARAARRAHTRGWHVPAVCQRHRPISLRRPCPASGCHSAYHVVAFLPTSTPSPSRAIVVAFAVASGRQPPYGTLVEPWSLSGGTRS